MKISDKRQKLIDALNASEIKIGDTIIAKLPNSNKTDGTLCIVKSINMGMLTLKRSDSSVYNKNYTITLADMIGRQTVNVGANPFDESNDNVRPVAFTLSSVLFNLDVLGEKRGTGAIREKFKMEGIAVSDLNWNPYIYKNSKKEYYQRGFVWTIKDKQLLVESIYQGIDCGKLLVRKRGWKELEQMAAAGETELSFNDIVDGKQRLNAIKEFIEEKFADLHGNYYGDLSALSQHKLTDHQLFSYSELPENTQDASVIRQFLKLNFTGVAQSAEHINFVKSLT